MTDQPEPSRALLDAQGVCRDCGSTAYTRHELTLHEGQNFRCYRCFDIARGYRWPLEWRGPLPKLTKAPR
jgi:hypothetical protein